MIRRFLIFLLTAWIVVFGLTGVAPAEYRSYDGTENNLVNPSWGAAGTQLPRLAGAAYDDGISTPRGFTDPTLPNPRLVSNTIVAQLVMAPNSHAMTDWVFQWGQFVDHDLGLTDLEFIPEPYDR